MMKLANEYADRLNPVFGIPQIRPVPGQSFDRNNDLHLCDCGTVVLHRDGYVTRGTIYSVTSDALIDYNRRHMSTAAFNDHYGDGDERSESMMLHGADA